MNRTETAACDRAALRGSRAGRKWLRPAAGLLAVMALVVVPSPLRGQGRALPASDSAAVLQTVSAYPAGWLAGDSAAVLRLFTADAVLQPHHGAPPVLGLSAIREFWWPTAGPPTRVTELALDVDEVAGVPDLAYVRGTFRLAFVFEDEAGSHARRNAGNFLMILRKEGPGWKIARFIWNDPIPQ